MILIGRGLELPYSSLLEFQSFFYFLCSVFNEHFRFQSCTSVQDFLFAENSYIIQGIFVEISSEIRYNLNVKAFDVLPELFIPSWKERND